MHAHVKAHVRLYTTYSCSSLQRVYAEYFSSCMYNIGLELQNRMLTILQCIVSIYIPTVLDDVLRTCVLATTIKPSGDQCTPAIEEAL